jgi:hypothetical protein
MLRELATTCPRNREDLQAAYAALPPLLSPFVPVLRAAVDVWSRLDYAGICTLFDRLLEAGMLRLPLVMVLPMPARLPLPSSR